MLPYMSQSSAAPLRNVACHLQTKEI